MRYTTVKFDDLILRNDHTSEHSLVITKDCITKNGCGTEVSLLSMVFPK